MRRRNWAEIRAEAAARDPEGESGMNGRRRRIIAEHEVYERRLPDLRKARAMTQQDLAAKLEVSQAQVSRIENQTDMYLSTLAQYVAALGGQLKLVAEFDGQEVPVSLPAFEATDEEEALVRV